MRCCSRRCATSSSTSGLIVASSSLASCGVKWRRTGTPMILGVVVAGQRLEGRHGVGPAPPPARTARSAVEIFLWSRSAIWVAALLALLTLEPLRNPKAGRWDDPALTHDLGAVTG